MGPTYPNYPITTRRTQQKGTNMLPHQLLLLWSYLQARTRAAGGWNESGTVVEKVILTAIFAALAIAWAPSS